jgi:protein-disulfide isomerase
LNEVIAQNKAKVVFHPMTFIGPESILAANAAACAADENEFMAMNLALFQDQSAEENSGKWQGDALLNIGKSIGINSAKFETCIKDGSYVNWTGNVATATAKADVNGTPTIFVNGKELDRSKENNEYGDPVKFRAALAAGGVK